MLSYTENPQAKAMIEKLAKHYPIISDLQDYFLYNPHQNAVFIKIASQGGMALQTIMERLAPSDSIEKVKPSFEDIAQKCDIKVIEVKNGGGGFLQMPMDLIALPVVDIKTLHNALDITQEEVHLTSESRQTI